MLLLLFLHPPAPVGVPDFFFFSSPIAAFRSFTALFSLRFSDKRFSTFFLSTLVSVSDTSSCSFMSLTLPPTPPPPLSPPFPLPPELIFFSCCTRLSFSSSSRESFSV